MGALRLYLAICVAVTHYAPYWRPSWIAFSMVAVPLFYLVSGFYMSLVLTQTYSRPGGARRFYLNRALRIFPPYYVALAIMTVTILLRIDPSPQYFTSLDVHWIFDQFTVLPRVVWRHLTLDMENPTIGITMAQFYTVGLEMMFYAVAPLVVRLRTRTLLIMLPVALALHFLPHHLGLDARYWQYDFFPSLLVFFLMGCLSYRLYVAVRGWRFPRWVGFALLPAIMLLSAASPRGDWTNASWPWVIYGIAALGIPFLFIASDGSKLDRWLGDQSYPLYLTHNTAIWIAIASPWATGAVGAAYFTAVSAIMTLSIWFFVDRPIEWIRAKIAAGRITWPRMALTASPGRAPAAPESAA